LAEHVKLPTVVKGVGQKLIEEFAGRASTADERVSIARMTSPPGWEEPAQTPEFDEWTLVLEGRVVVEHEGGRIEAGPGEAVVAKAGERVRYSTPEGAQYVAVCLPAFAPETAHRDG
jgi:ethanolamine utilization protein EutQ (cupin superfamily)